jgi:hypothetical protein
MHIAQRVTKMPNLVMISQNYNATDESPILPRRKAASTILMGLISRNSDIRPASMCDIGFCCKGTAVLP